MRRRAERPAFPGPGFDEHWPEHLAVPQVSIEFDVADVNAVHTAAEELTAAGYELLHPVRREPWGQTVVRLFSPEGAIVGVSYVPSMHERRSSRRRPRDFPQPFYVPARITVGSPESSLTPESS